MQLEILNQKLYNDDWRRVIPNLPDRSVDLLLTDPPYATTNLKWDKPVDWKEFWTEIHRVCKPNAPMVVFASGKFVPELLNSNLKNFRYELIWEKSLAVGFLDANRRPLRAHEQMLVFCQQWKSSTYNPQFIEGKPHKRGGRGKRKPSHYAGQSKEVPETETNLYHPRSVLRFDSAVRGNKSLHPTAKPLELVKWLVQSFSNRGATVLDPFVGSGTTLAACALAGRSGVGVELNEEYFAVATERLRQIEAEENGTGN
jgi:site-specific DNA-methyltransferase (adenine-specific)